MSLYCPYCDKKLHDETNPNRWSEFNIAQHKKHCKSKQKKHCKSVEKNKNHIGIFFGKILYDFM